jgi:hypothetical protein
MRSILLFVEDDAHEKVLVPLLEYRLSEQHDLDLKVETRSATGGAGRAVSQLKAYLAEVKQQTGGPLPDLFVVAIDANCHGWSKRRDEILEAAGDYRELVATAIPDPHIERWLLLDSGAFRKVVGRGCRAPDHKCDRDRYKNKLIEAIQQAGQVPFLGGIEYAEDIVRQWDIEQCKKDASFRAFVDEVTAFSNRWSSEGDED